MEIAAVEQREVDRGASERLRRVKPAEPAADNYHFRRLLRHRALLLAGAPPRSDTHRQSPSSIAMSQSLNFKQELTACFGKPVAENPTQVMVEAAYRHHGLAWRYLTIEVDPAGLGEAVRGARAMGFAGFNCTIPHKVAVIPHLDGLGESAALMGAVNCVVRRGARLIGENTDGKGFVTALGELTDPAGKRVVMFGAGGAARAIGVELALAGATRITIVNRGLVRGHELVDLLANRTKVATDFAHWTGDYRIPAGTDV